MKILLCGEMPFMAGYFRVISQHNGWSLDHIESGQSFRDLEEDYQLFILSDYSHRLFAPDAENTILRQVELGKGLMMVGGWSSFTGLDGNYLGSHFEAALPVACLNEDDRVNEWQGFLLQCKVDHPIIKGLDWQQPPVIIGYNRVLPKPGAVVVLEALPIRPGFSHSTPNLAPVLVTGLHGLGRTCAYMSDLVPHWCGGLVDWGLPRVAIKPFEFGAGYLKFVSQLIGWTAGL